MVLVGNEAARAAQKTRQKADALLLHSPLESWDVASSNPDLPADSTAKQAFSCCEILVWHSNPRSCLAISPWLPLATGAWLKQRNFTSATTWIGDKLLCKQKALQSLVVLSAATAN